MDLVTRADLDRCLSEAGAYHTSALPGQAYHTDPTCVWGTRIKRKYLQAGLGKNRRRCQFCGKGAGKGAEMPPVVGQGRDRDLERLADLIRTRNSNEVSITKEIGRPAMLGHIAEHIASRIFDIRLHERADHPGNDGWFQSGPYQGRSVDVKARSRREGFLAIREDCLPDLFLVMTGPKATAGRTAGEPQPWCIEEVYLFEARPLVRELKARRVKIGAATSIRQDVWRAARIHPEQATSSWKLTEFQKECLRLFSLSSVATRF